MGERDKDIYRERRDLVVVVVVVVVLIVIIIIIIIIVIIIIITTIRIQKFLITLIIYNFHWGEDT